MKLNKTKETQKEKAFGQTFLNHKDLIGKIIDKARLRHMEFCFGCKEWFGEKLGSHNEECKDPKFWQRGYYGQDLWVKVSEV